MSAVNQIHESLESATCALEQVPANEVINAAERLNIVASAAYLDYCKELPLLLDEDMVRGAQLLLQAAAVLCSRAADVSPPITDPRYISQATACLSRAQDLCERFGCINKELRRILQDAEMSVRLETVMLQNR